MKKLKDKSKAIICWNVSPYDYSNDKVRDIISIASSKYGLPKSSIKVIPQFTTQDKDGKDVTITSDITSNIQNPDFQKKLFREYIDINKIEGYDWDLICGIDDDINNNINYSVYDKYRRYKIKWVKWSNFLSYGSDNFLDFSNMRGLVLLNGRNQSGKTTLALDLIRFLLFGSITKYQTQDKIFNKFIPEATSVTVEGCICVDDEDYVIKRTLSRPSLNKRTAKSRVSQKVEYFKIVGDNVEELEDYTENKQEDSTKNTNKRIKEVIGIEDDFDLVMSVTDASLDSLIEKKDTERGRLFSRWIGLLPIEEKGVIAREKFNQSIKPSLLSNKYNIEDLNNEITTIATNINDILERNSVIHNKINNITKEINKLERKKEKLLLSKQNIDNELLKIDITTLNRSIEDVTALGKRKKEELDAVVKEIDYIGDIDFSIEDYDNIISKTNDMNVDKSVMAEKYKLLSMSINELKNSEYCPTCGRKFDNIDNSKKISEIEAELETIKNKGIELKKQIDSNNSLIESMKVKREQYYRKGNLTVQKSAYELNIEQLRNRLIELRNTLKEYNKNSDAIDANNKLDIDIANVDILLNNKREEKTLNEKYIINNESTISLYKEEISRREDIINEINKEVELVKNWKIYLDMVGKNGISKMVLRKTLPIINARLSQLLNDVCDFDVEVRMNDKNEVSFNIIKDGVLSDLSGGSGFEKTASSLALRAVLADISTIPKSSFILFDEILGRVDEENYDNMHNLFNKILTGYDFIISVNHIKECKDWFNKIINVTKKDNISVVEIDNRENV